MFEIVQLFIAVLAIEAFNDLSFQALKNKACKVNYPYNPEIENPEKFIQYPWKMGENLDFYNIHFYTNLIQSVKDIHDKTNLVTNNVRE